MRQDPTNLLWIDLEMTGLDPDRDHIIEIATIVTNASLEILAEGPELAIRQSEAVLAGMDEWNTEQHTSSGLVDRIRGSDVNESEAERLTLEFVEEYVAPRVSPMCGNSICMDRRFLHRHMPRLERHFHYRNLDVSTIKELCQRWAPGLAARVEKSGNHRAMDDVRESIEELRFYREHFLRSG